MGSSRTCRTSSRAFPTDGSYSISTASWERWARRLLGPLALCLGPAAGGMRATLIASRYGSCGLVPPIAHETAMSTQNELRPPPSTRTTVLDDLAQDFDRAGSR